MIKIKAFFKKEDLWIGAFIDPPRKTLYLCCITLGIKIQWGSYTIEDLLSPKAIMLRLEINALQGDKDMLIDEYHSKMMGHDVGVTFIAPIFPYQKLYEIDQELNGLYREYLIELEKVIIK